MYRVLIFLLLSIAAATAPASPLDSVAKVEIGLSRLSGVVIYVQPGELPASPSRVYIATSAHGFRGEQGRAVTVYPPSSTPINIDRIEWLGDVDHLDSDPTNDADLAIISGTSLNPPAPAELALEDVSPSSSVMLAGYREGTGRLETVAAAAAPGRYLNEPRTERYSVFSAPSPQGYSGGAVYASGRLLGLIQNTDRRQTYCVTLARLRAVMRRLFPAWAARRDHARAAINQCPPGSSCAPPGTACPPGAACPVPQPALPRVEASVTAPPPAFAAPAIQPPAQLVSPALEPPVVGFGEPIETPELPLKLPQLFAPSDPISPEPGSERGPAIEGGKGGSFIDAVKEAVSDEQRSWPDVAWWLVTAGASVAGISIPWYLTLAYRLKKRRDQRRRGGGRRGRRRSAERRFRG